MCGINGFNWEDTALLARMNDATKHRGPDGVGSYSSPGISLGHNRLAVIDLSENAAQPMASTDKSTIIVFNGEVYNFRELKRELAEYAFKSESDTEIILAAYKKWGTAAFARFNGMFAFALWDTNTRELILARDRAGVKPLYYYWDGKQLIFSSEIKAVLEHDIPRTIDSESLVQYLRLLYVPAPHTMFAHIKKLEPGFMLRLVRGAVSIEPFVAEAVAYEGPVTDQALCAVIDHAVERQLVSDRPLGIYLSGGFDSSILLDSVSRRRSSVNTFSIGFDLGDTMLSDKYNADQTIARRTAEHYGAIHHEVLLSSVDAAGQFEKTVWHMDEPNGNPTAIAMMHLASFVKPLATVVFSGDGGDELFGGYERYRLSLLSSYYRKLPASLRKIGNSLDDRLSKLDTSAGVDRFARFLFQKDDVFTRVIGADLPLNAAHCFFERKFFAHVGTADFEELFMDVDRRSWLVDEDLLRTDKMAMSSGVEARVPFLDNEVVAFSARIPRREKITLMQSKRMLKRAFCSRLPGYLYTEPKRGWFTPAAKWLRHKRFHALALEILSPSYCEATRELFRWDEIRFMLEAHISGKSYNLTMLWALMTLQVWARKFELSA